MLLCYQHVLWRKAYDGCIYTERVQTLFLVIIP